jgi:hypothetical protein
MSVKRKPSLSYIFEFPLVVSAALGVFLGQVAVEVAVDPLNMETYVETEKHGSEADEQEDMHGKVLNVIPLEPKEGDEGDGEVSLKIYPPPICSDIYPDRV